MDVGVNHRYMDKDISCDERHAQPPSVGCNLETRVLEKIYLANMVRWNTGTTKDNPEGERDRWVR